ncbi:MAG: class I SAM-dependent methyltransferase [Chlamydiae bacterium]|nr:class I SAM-dependent methyltransferase [Chlamydiota bacterium]
MYLLLDSGNQQKLEKFGSYTLVRPCSSALWKPRLNPQLWSSADAHFTRKGENKWEWKAETKLPNSWEIDFKNLRFKISPTDFGHLGLFPEHAKLWEWAAHLIQRVKKPIKILNLFAYTGGATLAFAKAGAEVCHLDASKAAVQWARENASLNHLEDAPIRWIIEDIGKFLKREIKREKKYDAIILDPPSFGRGAKGEIFKFERDIFAILQACRNLLSTQPLFFILSSHTLGVTPTVLSHLLTEAVFDLKGRIEANEMWIESEIGKKIPSGCFVRWQSES